MSKLIFCLALFIFALSAQAAKYDCESYDKKWQVLFELEGETIHDLVFLKEGQIFKTYSEVKGIKNRIFKTEYWEFDLGAPKYFDFDRRVGAKTFEAAFFLKYNPFSPEIGVTCQEE